MNENRTTETKCQQKEQFSRACLVCDYALHELTVVISMHLRADSKVFFIIFLKKINLCIQNEFFISYLMQFQYQFNSFQSVCVELQITKLFVRAVDNKAQNCSWSSLISGSNHPMLVNGDTDTCNNANWARKTGYYLARESFGRPIRLGIMTSTVFLFFSRSPGDLQLGQTWMFEETIFRGNKYFLKQLILYSIDYRQVQI